MLVLVERWLQPEDFGAGPGQVSVDEKVPTTLYLPDGRTVPVCVVQVDPAEPARDPVPAWVWPERVIGGGLPVITRSQGEEHVASVGTLVTDGHTVYALTARHVCGPAGTPVSTRLRRQEVEVGQASRHQLMRVPFDVAYPDLVCHRTYLTLDAGLVEVDELADWTSQTYGLPPAGPFADLSEHNLTTKLVNAEVVAFGAASGYLRGRIAALLFRYRSIGGYDDITDFLIAPGPGQHGSQPGDSGSVWHLSQTADDGSVQLLPIALQWGGENLVGATPGRGFNFALASSLTNVLRLLDVSLVVDHNTQAQPFWGKTGHYTIASLACEHLRTSRLKTLMRNNLDRIGFQLSALDPDDIDGATTKLSQNPRFVPLADVPDLVWKNLPTTVVGGRDTSFNRGPEHPTHYADIDEPRSTDGKTLRQLCMADPTLVDVEAWQEFYSSLGHSDPADRGLLPFRVWQFYDEMVDAAAAGDAARFVCAAGLVSHYVGDASQPLHGSYLADGVPATPTAPALGQGVHSAYESSMVDAFSAEILAGLQATLTHRGAEQGQILSGHDAAVAVVRLMDRTARTLEADRPDHGVRPDPGGEDDVGPDGHPGRPRHLVGPRRQRDREGDGRRHAHPRCDLGGRVPAGKGQEHDPDGEHQGRRPGRAPGALRGSRLRAVPRPGPHRVGAEAAAGLGRARVDANLSWGRSGPVVTGCMPAQLHPGLRPRQVLEVTQPTLDRTQREVELGRDGLVGQAGEHQRQDLPVEGRQPVVRPAAGSKPASR